ncbi:MAG: glycosyltransferase [Rhizomicrobium sp.]
MSDKIASHAVVPEAGLPEEPPSVAVVIPCWNAEKWIARAIQSVLDQNYPNLEIIVIDDGSTDGSLDIIKSFGDKIRWETGPNRGACVARNRSITLNTAEFILFLDADDYLEGDILLGLSEAISNNQADIAFGPGIVEYTNYKRELRMYSPEASKSDIVSSVVFFTGARTGSVLWRRDFLLEIGGWDVRLGRLQDYFLILRGIARCSTFAISQLGGSVWYEHEGANRVSRQRTSETELSVLLSYRENMPEFQEYLSKAEKLKLASNIYFLSLDLRRRGYKKEAALGFNLCRSLGLSGHVGNFRHRFLCSLLGLDLKERLSSLNRDFHTLRARQRVDI